MKLKLFSVILVLSLVLACGLALSSCVDKGNEYLNRAEINLYVQENGDVKVTERWMAEVEGEKPSFFHFFLKKVCTAPFFSSAGNIDHRKTVHASSQLTTGATPLLPHWNWL